MTTYAPNKAGILLRTMQPGRPQVILGTPVERMGSLYRVRGRPELVGLEQAVQLISGGQMPKDYSPAIPEYPDTLRGISVGGAYSWLLTHGYQDIETRTTATRHRGWTLVQVPTGKQWDESFDDYPHIPREQCPKGSIIGAICIAECTWHEKDEIYEYHVSAACHFPEPVPGCKGHRTPVWSPGKDNVLAFNRAWAILSAAIAEMEDAE